MSKAIDRRRFLEMSASAGLSLGAYASVSAAPVSTSPNERIVLGVMGVNGRGSALARGFAAMPDAAVAYICDVDSRVIDKTVAATGENQQRRPQGVEDFRRILDDKSIDALVIAAPNHWHAPATILACSAGKHVYVEKPCSHNPREGELAVEAARKHKRVVTMGTQRRSFPAIIEAIDKLHQGEIGRVLYARTWYNNRRPPIGEGQQVPAPSWLNYDLWQGPAPEKPYKDNIVHYNWHWHWHWGNGELGNNGVHALDVARWGMDVDYPTRVVSGGGKFRHEDSQQTPDTHMVTYEFDKGMITWEGLSWSPLGPYQDMFGMSFHGDNGSLVITGSGYTIYDMYNKERAKSPGKGGDGEHFANFLHSIRTGSKPNADIEEAHKSTLLCHLGNISQRTGRALDIDSSNGHIVNDEEAMQLWSREYQPGWEPSV